MPKKFKELKRKTTKVDTTPTLKVEEREVPIRTDAEKAKTIVLRPTNTRTGYAAYRQQQIQKKIIDAP